MTLLKNLDLELTMDYFRTCKKVEEFRLGLVKRLKNFLDLEPARFFKHTGYPVEPYWQLEPLLSPTHSFIKVILKRSLVIKIG
jgi:hypothetical protein